MSSKIILVLHEGPDFRGVLRPNRSQVLKHLRNKEKLLSVGSDNIVC